MATKFNNRRTPSPGMEVKLSKWTNAIAADIANSDRLMDDFAMKIALQFYKIAMEDENRDTGDYARSLRMVFDKKKWIHPDRFLYVEDEGRGAIEYGRTKWPVTKALNKGEHPKSKKGQEGKFVFQELIRRAKL